MLRAAAEVQSRHPGCLEPWATKVSAAYVLLCASCKVTYLSPLLQLAMQCPRPASPLKALCLAHTSSDPGLHVCRSRRCSRARWARSRARRPSGWTTRGRWACCWPCSPSSPPRGLLLQSGSPSRRASQACHQARLPRWAGRDDAGSCPACAVRLSRDVAGSRCWCSSVRQGRSRVLVQRQPAVSARQQELQEAQVPVLRSVSRGRVRAYRAGAERSGQTQVQLSVALSAGQG